MAGALEGWERLRSRKAGELVISLSLLRIYAGHTITGFTHVSPAMGGSVAVPVASGRVWGETRRRRSLRRRQLFRQRPDATGARRGRPDHTS